MKALAALIARDLRRDLSGGGAWVPVAFFLLVATLYPFAVGADAALLARTGGGIAWIAALLAALLPIERLFRTDADDGTLDQLALRGVAEEWVALARLVAHALAFTLPLLLATLPASALLGIPAERLWRLIWTLAIGAPGLAALAVMIAAITLGARAGATLGGLMLLPLAVPLLIFGASALDPAAIGPSPLLLVATSLLLAAIAPLIAGAALRAARER